MPSSRYTEALKIATELPEEERAELARVLVRTLADDFQPTTDEDGFSEEWKAEIKRRLKEEPRGEALTSAQLRVRVDRMISHDE
jgi:non-homologous end joining protein Ku